MEKAFLQRQAAAAESEESAASPPPTHEWKSGPGNFVPLQVPTDLSANPPTDPLLHSKTGSHQVQTLTSDQATLVQVIPTNPNHSTVQIVTTADSVATFVGTLEDHQRQGIGSLVYRRLQTQAFLQDWCIGDKSLAELYGLPGNLVTRTMRITGTFEDDQLTGAVSVGGDTWFLEGEWVAGRPVRWFVYDRETGIVWRAFHQETRTPGSLAAKDVQPAVYKFYLRYQNGSLASLRVEDETGSLAFRLDTDDRLDPLPLSDWTAHLADRVPFVQEEAQVRHWSGQWPLFPSLQSMGLRHQAAALAHWVGTRVQALAALDQVSSILSPTRCHVCDVQVRYQVFPRVQYFWVETASEVWHGTCYDPQEVMCIDTEQPIDQVQEAYRRCTVFSGVMRPRPGSVCDSSQIRQATYDIPEWVAGAAHVGDRFHLGHFRDNLLAGHAKIFYRDGKTLAVCGPFVAGVLHGSGQGQVFNEHGQLVQRCSGWKQGAMQGVGELYWTVPDPGSTDSTNPHPVLIRKGLFVQNQLHGPNGSVYDFDGRLTHRGTFQQGFLWHGLLWVRGCWGTTRLAIQAGETRVITKLGDEEEECA